MKQGEAADRRPLSGVRVVETSSYMTGPFAGLQLADLGADVLKIEPKDGDPFRRFAHQKDGLSATWASSNRDKRHLFLDLKDPADRDRALEEIAAADVLIGNWRPHVAESLGLGRDTVRRINPRIINLAVSGFGLNGSMVDKPAYDSLIQARTGICHYGRPQDAPELPAFWIVDKVVGVQAAQAVLAALYQREVTGEGCDIDLAMLDATAYFNMPDMMQTRVFEGDAGQARRTPSTLFQTSDGHILICPVNGKQMMRTLEAIGNPGWKPEITDAAHPVERTEAFYRHVGAAVRSRSSAEWLRIFAEHDVPAGPVWTIDEHLADPQVADNETYSMIGDEGDRMRAVRYPAIFNGRKLKPRKAAQRMRPAGGKGQGR